MYIHINITIRIYIYIYIHVYIYIYTYLFSRAKDANGDTRQPTPVSYRAAYPQYRMVLRPSLLFAVSVCVRVCMIMLWIVLLLLVYVCRFIVSRLCYCELNLFACSRLPHALVPRRICRTTSLAPCLHQSTLFALGLALDVVRMLLLVCQWPFVKGN